jgi:hypothetical protein
LEVAKKHVIVPKSLRGYTKLVRMSAKKKCLNLTRPKGDIKMFHSTMIKSFLAL